MRYSAVAKIGLVIACLVAGWALAQQAASQQTVTFDRPIHFTAPDGSDLEVPAGPYQVEPAGESRLRLSPTSGGAPFLIQAQPTTHEASLELPLALAVATDEDRTDMVLLMPDKTALDAQGSHTGIRSRADLSQPVTAFQLNQAAGLNLKRMTPVVAPIALYPADGAVITGPSFGVQWLPGVGQSAQARYEICVMELHQSCSAPPAVVVKIPTGIILTQPSQTQQSAPLGSKPGDPNFERPAGTTTGSSTTYRYGVMLPLHFLGKQLQWSVTACVPVTGQGAIGQIPAQMPESCASSAPKPITWTILPPTLSAPADYVLLPNLLPTFSWTHGNQYGVEYFLVCIAKPNVPCPVQPGVQPHVFVTRVQNALGFTPPHDLSPFVGHTLHWTVAVCNAALGCFYQPQHRRLNVPIDGSFDSIYPVTQNAKCKNCHQMHAENDTYLRHIQLGRFTREEIPPSNVGGDVFVRGDGFINVDKWVNKCQSCHTSATGFTDGWRAPHFRFSFDQPIDGRMCDEFKLPRGGINLQPPTTHLLHDVNILWAVDRIPGLGRLNWQQKVNAWFGAGAPCGPTEGRRRGQFTP
ncbi:MAG: hypothetical protein NTNFB02_08350 [Nitrospira sp.]